ncbi:Protein transport Sec1b [Smittium culicis]|uniref:Protein transport Sec1b n=2 Tax=Smittium culicis TaxID=133412 RepID=A0A1R1Y1H6_9FUNG|nr:Protein transport Sec1b [Smittium culicis]
MYSPNSKSSQDRDIDTIVDRLLAVVSTLNCKPFIRYYSPPKFEIKTKKQQSKDKKPTVENEFTKHIPTTPSIAEKIAKAFNEKYSKYCISNPEFMNSASETNDDIILFLDRSADMISPLIHEFTYQAMVNDLLDLEQGKKYK